MESSRLDGHVAGPTDVTARRRVVLSPTTVASRHECEQVECQDS
jgi:hypothetical protein